MNQLVDFGLKLNLHIMEPITSLQVLSQLKCLTCSCTLSIGYFMLYKAGRYLHSAIYNYHTSYLKVYENNEKNIFFP